MARCTFCGTEIERGTGKVVVQRDSTILHFCTRRCEKNMVELGRNPLRVPWTLRFRQFTGKAKGAEAMVIAVSKEKAKDTKTPKFEEAKKEEKKEEKK